MNSNISGPIEGVLNRSEMKLIIAGSGSCTVSVTCPNGRTLECTSASGQCYSEGDGTQSGYINCNVGEIQAGCWQHDPPSEPVEN
jgi:hypothetical protein